MKSRMAGVLNLCFSIFKGFLLSAPFFRGLRRLNFGKIEKYSQSYGRWIVGFHEPSPDFGDAVLAGRSCKTGAKFVTWEWDFDRQGVHAGHYFMENYEAAKQDFAVRAGLVESQRLFSDEQLAVIRNACAFALEDDATLSYAEEKQLQSVQEQIELLLPQQTQEQRPTMEQTM